MYGCKKILTVLAVISTAAICFAHLPGVHDASLRTGRTGTGVKASMNKGQKLRGETRADYSWRGEWESSQSYGGDFTNHRGDTVSCGEFNGKKLIWWAKFAAAGDDKPGVIKEGGTSAWVLVNSISASNSARGTPSPSWSGWNGDLQNKGGNNWAVVATWRNGAQGAYSFTHDDIGAMPFETAIKPGWDVAKDFPDIKQSWGIYVAEMEDWDEVIEMVKEGHELFNHSMDHTSAANRWFIFNPGETVTPGDPDIPENLRGLEVTGAWKIRSHNAGTDKWTNWIDLPSDNASGNKSYADLNGDWSGPLTSPYDDGTYIDTVQAENDLVTISAYPYWEGRSPSDEGFPNKGIMKIVPKSGTTTVEISDTKQQVYVNRALGKISVNAIGWFEAADIYSKYPWYNNKAIIPEGEHKGETYVEADKGRSGYVLMLHTANGWTPQLETRNVEEANVIINQKLYSWVGATPYFKNGKRSEYFGYPFDVSSNENHDHLERAGFVGARAGAKSGVPMPSDFFHPYRIDFDAFFIEKTDWDPSKQGAGYVYPDNAHVLLGLNQMVDEIIAKKGYMVREFHAVADFPTQTNAWYNSNPNPDMWPVNNDDEGKGGWWGGIAAFQLRAHYQYVKGKIDAKQIVVYTPSEAIKYRTTANATNKDGALTKDGNNYKLKLTTTENIAEKYRDEISVIVSLENACDFLAVEYGDGSGFDVAPYRKPVKMDNSGKIWSVSVNPFRSGGQTTLIPNGEWRGVETSQDGDGTAISDKKSVAFKQNPVSFAGIRNGHIALNLKAGNYTAELYNLQGRLINRENINAVNGVNATGLRTDNLSKGLFILNVKQAGKVLLNNKIMIK